MIHMRISVKKIYVHFLSTIANAQNIVEFILKRINSKGLATLFFGIEIK